MDKSSPGRKVHPGSGEGRERGSLTCSTKQTCGHEIQIYAWEIGRRNCSKSASHDTVGRQHARAPHLRSMLYRNYFQRSHYVRSGKTKQTEDERQFRRGPSLPENERQTNRDSSKGKADLTCFEQRNAHETRVRCQNPSCKCYGAETRDFIGKERRNLFMILKLFFFGIDCPTKPRNRFQRPQKSSKPQFCHFPSG